MKVIPWVAIGWAVAFPIRSFSQPEPNYHSEHIHLIGMAEGFGIANFTNISTIPGSRQYEPTGFGAVNLFFEKNNGVLALGGRLGFVPMNLGSGLNLNFYKMNPYIGIRGSKTFHLSLYTGPYVSLVEVKSRPHNLNPSPVDAGVALSAGLHFGPNRFRFSFNYTREMGLVRFFGKHHSSLLIASYLELRVGYVVKW